MLYMIQKKYENTKKKDHYVTLITNIIKYNYAQEHVLKKTTWKNI